MGLLGLRRQENTDRCLEKNLPRGNELFFPFLEETPNTMNTTLSHNEMKNAEYKAQ